MRRRALDWTLSRRQRMGFGTTPQRWEQYSRGEPFGIGVELVDGKKRNSKVSAEETEILRCMFSNGMDV